MSRIMIIDDDVEMAKLTAQLLRKQGHTVISQDTVKGAIDKLIREKPDLLVLDVMFPDSPAGGFDLARKIRQTREIKDLPVILLTSVNQEFPMGFSMDDADEDWLPIQAFLEKPVDAAKISAKIAEVLGKKK